MCKLRTKLRQVVRHRLSFFAVRQCLRAGFPGEVGPQAPGVEHAHLGRVQVDPQQLHPGPRKVRVVVREEEDVAVPAHHGLLGVGFLLPRAGLHEVRGPKSGRGASGRKYVQATAMVHAQPPWPDTRIDRVIKRAARVQP